MPIPAIVIEGIETATAVAEAISKMSDLIPSPPAELQDTRRWLTVTVFNETQYPLIYAGSYFDSGRFWTAPTNVAPYGQMTFSGCNVDTSAMTGVSGGVLFTLPIPQNPQTIAAGFSNPYWGSYKASVVPNATAEAAYDAIQEGTTSATIPSMSGTDTNNHPVTLSFTLVSESGAEASVTVTQQVSGD